jgi:hypothetical protein
LHLELLSAELFEAFVTEEVGVLLNRLLLLFEETFGKEKET